ncbi:MAG: DUF1848 domain-containing protein [Bacillota bacterium]
MIISASRRTDIPKFYSEWFMNRVRAGFCTFPNPFNPNQVIRVSLRPEDVDVIVFWSKDPEPLIQHLGELDRRGLRYYFQFTVNGYPRFMEPNVPPLGEVLDTFGRLSETVSPDRMIWRYDPIVLSNVTGLEYHVRQFGEIAGALKGKTKRVVVSPVHYYRGPTVRLARLSKHGIYVRPFGPHDPETARLLATMARVAGDSGMEIVSCAAEYSLIEFGIKPGKCIDDEYIAGVFGIRVTGRKDLSQRAACGCVQSKDIGVYGTCRHGCVYCYATSTGGPRSQHHDIDSPSLG